MIALTGSQIRQLVDMTQLYEAYRAAKAEQAQRFIGSMSWKTVGGHQYLYRKRDDRWRSLGPHNPETEKTYDRFHSGRDAIVARIATLDQAMRAAAPVNRAMRLGRVPWTSARVLRRLDRLGTLARGMRTVGTHALFAYEALAGAFFADDEIATADIDLLCDARASLRLVGSDRGNGLIGELRRIDPTFRPTAPGSFRAVNDAGFLVDLVTPVPPDRITASLPPKPGSADDLVAVEIEGLGWLANCPAIERVVIDERGFPLSMTVPDPRVFVLHKWWLGRRDDRDPLKRRRDRAQARAVAGVILSALPDYPFDDPAIAAVPAALLDSARQMLADVGRALPETGDWD